MRIVAFGDTHTQHHNLKLPKGDVLIFAGDGEFRHVLRQYAHFGEGIQRSRA